MNNIPDYENRRLAVSTFDKNIVVTAGAGTGKTTLLVDRILCLLMRPHEPLKITDIVALTFTNKAAGEMRSRLRKKLEGIIAKPSPPPFPPPQGGRVKEAGEGQGEGEQGGTSRENRILSEILNDFQLSDLEIRKRARNALADIEKAQICTMHSFAGYVLRLYPVEAGIDPGFKEDDGTAFEDHFEREWEDWLDTELSKDPAHRELWEHILEKTTLDSLKDFVRELCKETIPLDSLIPYSSFPSPNQGVGFIPTFPLPQGEGQGEGGANPAFISWLNSNNLQIQELLNKYAIDRPKLRKVEKLLIASEEVFNDVLSEVPPEIMDDDTSTKPADWEEEDYETAVRLIKSAKRLSLADDKYFSRVMELCLPFAEQCRERFTASGYISFDGLLSFCCEILKNRREVREDLKNRFKAVLVDEFQDTDPVQYEIVLYLAEISGQHETDWHKVKLIPGKLFIVGDPKQSIYSFRKADIEAYSQVSDMVLSDNPGSRTDLLTNFRSNNRIIDVVNGMFSQLIKKHGFYQPDYVSLVNRAGNEAFLDDQKVELRIIDGGENEDINAQKAVRLEAEAIGRWIKDEVIDKKEVPGPDGKKMPVLYRHIAILLRKLTDVNEYLEVLRKYDIPYTVEGEKHFYSTQEVIDFVNLLRIIDNPADSLAMAGVLRSPLGGLSDKEIYELNRLSLLDYRSNISQPLEKAGHGGFELPILYERLSILKKRAGAMPVPDAIQYIFDTLPVLEFAASSYNGEQAAANLMKIQKIAESQSDRGGLTLKGFTSLLEKNITQLQEEGESLLSEEAVNAVRILSIHKAKGLEFPVVILAGTHSYPNVREENIIAAYDWSTGTTGLKLNNLRNRASVMHYDKNTLKDAEEQKRLLYVAMTRARESLIISGTRCGKLNKNCFLEMIRQVTGDFPCEGDSGDILLGEGKINQTIIKYDTLKKEKTSAVRKADDVTGKAGLLHTHDSLDAEEISRQWTLRTNRYNEMQSKTVFITPTMLEKEQNESEHKQGLWVSQNSPPLYKGGAGGVFSGDRSLLIGTVIHHILEQWDFKNDRLMNDADFEEVIEKFIPVNASGNLSGIKDEVKGIMGKFLLSPVYYELKRVDILGREVPFTMSWDGQIIEGVIDLIYKDGDTIYIADYKTDKVTESILIPLSEEGCKGENENLITGKYSTSARVYIEAVKRCLGIVPGGFILIFLRPAKSVLINTT